MHQKFSMAVNGRKYETEQLKTRPEPPVDNYLRSRQAADLNVVFLINVTLWNIE